MKSHKLTLPDGAPEAGLLERLESYLWVDQITPVQTFGAFVYGTVPTGAWYEVRGIAKAENLPEPPTFSDQGEVWAWADAVRRHLFFVARAAISEAEEAGYAHDRHPEIEVGGDIFHDRETGLDIPRAQCTVRMWLREAS